MEVKTDTDTLGSLCIESTDSRRGNAEDQIKTKAQEKLEDARKDSRRVAL